MHMKYICSSSVHQHNIEQQVVVRVLFDIGGGSERCTVRPLQSVSKEESGEIRLRIM
jgi:hypothetical protein